MNSNVQEVIKGLIEEKCFWNFVTRFIDNWV